MTCASIEQWLDDYVDGALDSEAAREVEAHLAGCATCRAEVAAQRALSARLAGAPRSAQPARDLWPEIARARQEQATPARRWNIGWMQIAAAVVLMALSSATTYLMISRGRAPVPPVSVAVTPAPAPSSVRLVEAQYVPVANDLAALLETHRAELAPSTIATVERSLRVIDDAIAEARTALARDPNNTDLVDLFASGYRQKIDLLRRSTQLAPRT